jgi:plastocyanin
MLNRRWRPFVGVLALAIVTAACGGSSSGTGGSSSATTAASSASSEPAASPSSGGGQITIGSDTANDHGTKDVSGQASFAVEMNDFFFNPTVITGTPGQSLKLELKNDGSALHNFTLSDQSIDQDVQAGEDTSVMVTIPQSGFVEFFCKYHRSLGMVGELKTP